MAKVLVIEDDGISAVTLKNILSAKGFQVFETLEPNDVVRLCREFAVDVVVADIVLRCRDSGTDFARAIRQSCPDIPILFVSGTPLEGWSSHDLANIETLLPGRIAFLEKPFTVDTLINCLSRLLNSRYTDADLRQALREAKTFRHKRLF